MDEIDSIGSSRLEGGSGGKINKYNKIINLRKWRNFIKMLSILRLQPGMFKKLTVKRA